jgi:hypothetical protein
MFMSKVMHQMSANAEQAGVARGEALRDFVGDETQGTAHETEGTGSALLLEALTIQNLLKAMKRVKANKGAAGIDGMDIDQTVEDLNHHWSRIRSEHSAGTYQPNPVRRLANPKPDGGEPVDALFAAEPTWTALSFIVSEDTTPLLMVPSLPV